MRLDVIDFRDFYGTTLGRVVKRVVRDELRQVWPDVRGLSVLGLGYASPYLSLFQGDATRVLNFMGAGQGVMRWPVDEANQTALVEEMHLPLPDASVDRLLLCHGLENSEAVRPMLREIWRVLSPSGRLLIVTPNRRGLWSRIDRTPFGHGRPFSRGQLTQLMREAQFTPTHWGRALYMPPFEFEFMTGSSAAWEKMGARICPQFSGLLLLEASKQIYGMTADRPRLRVLRPVSVPKPAINMLKPNKDL
jgi:SAM-dependent methyltransferase